VHLVLGEDGAQMRVADNQDPVQELAAQLPMRRPQVAFIRGAWTAVRRITVPVAWKTASKEDLKFDPRSRITWYRLLGRVARQDVAARPGYWPCFSEGYCHWYE
jgi:hypothetical protein